jgi:hypothetical protein
MGRTYAVADLGLIVEEYYQLQPGACRSIRVFTRRLQGIVGLTTRHLSFHFSRSGLPSVVMVYNALMATIWRFSPWWGLARSKDRRAP